ncbi:2Fe-2S iron-sulfur cluster-binding protein [Phaeovulum sp. W22_SRMD_FR3]|uniref:2Fe-2S iron-sulfur cluster-binding protein n=1 Tax=Phaeovulum sp. W22_SRMD_FR3 TaxID=3240274 RepID=UPI003F9BA1D0
MPRTFTVAVRDQKFTVAAGDRLLDAALKNGVELPHDCRAGQCGACTLELTRGITLGGEAGCGNILACQARVFSDLEVTPHDAPETVLQNAVIEDIRDLAADVVKVIVRPRRPVHWLPGQYMKLQFRGYPARSFSPTAGLTDGTVDERLIFHIKKVRDGLVTPKLGAEIAVGSKLKVEGPFGHSFLRDDHPGRIILLGSGTGFAPIWAIAAAAQRRDRQRPIHLICGAKDAHAFYMDTALRKAARHEGTSVQVVLESLHPPLPDVHIGTPADHMPVLTAEDTVFAAGGPRMVERARVQAEAAGARFYADPFSPAPQPDRAPAYGLARLTRAFGRAR